MSSSEEQLDRTEDASGPGGPDRQLGEQSAADAIDKDDPHKVEKLSKLGHADDEAAEGSE